ncbi:MAG: hypothetical protein JO329_01375 [Planctomycetaceae bacterium]|nr:hypothetical protein [Planctomycetaceae bacterium]
MIGREWLARRQDELIVTRADGLGRALDRGQVAAAVHLVELDVAEAERAEVDRMIEGDGQGGRRGGQMGPRGRVDRDGGERAHASRFQPFDPGAAGAMRG